VHRARLPYRDFGLEYPPGALPVFAAPALVTAQGDSAGYALWFELLMLACGAASSALTGFLLAKQRVSAWRLAAGTLLAGLAPLALGPVVLSRFDLWPAALTIGAIAALVAERRGLAFVLLGVAIAAKIYPAVLVPLSLLYVRRRQGRRDALLCTAIVLAVVAAWFLPFVVASPHGVWSSLSGQARRPLQIESLGASVVLVAHQLWGYAFGEVVSSGSDNLAGRLPDALAAAQSVLVGLALVAVWIAFARGPATRDRLLRYSAAAICAFVALGKVLSPQYLIWLMALVPLVRGRRGIAAAALFVAALVLTQLWFPSRYIDLVYGLDARASWLVFARDVLLVALLLTLAWPTGRARRVGAALVAPLALLAAAAVGGAVAASTSTRSATHSGLLNETGIASSCRAPKPAPSANSGAVRYESRTYVNSAATPACVTVVVRPAAGAGVFSAAYEPTLDPRNPRARYVGDSGICTNVVGARPRRLHYAFVVPARSRFAVEVEPCRGVGLPTYTIEVRLRPLRP
jgi:hypothetical protein